MQLIKTLLVIPLYKNWFITCYLLLMLFSPYIDDLIQSLSKKKFRNLLVFSLICFSILPTFSNSAYYTVITAGGKNLTYFMFIYLIGRYIRIYYHEIKIPKGKVIFTFILATLLINIGNIFILKVLKKPVFLLAIDCSPLILISAISIFLLFKSYSFQSKMINWISSSILAVYLLDGTRLFWDFHIFRIEEYKNRISFIGIVFLEVLFCFTVSILVDKIRIKLFSKIEEKFIGFLIKNKSVLVNKVKTYLLSD